MDRLEPASHVAIKNFGCHQDEQVLVRRWHALAEEAQQGASQRQARRRRAWHGFAWPLGLLAYHFMRR